MPVNEYVYNGMCSLHILCHPNFILLLLNHVYVLCLFLLLFNLLYGLLFLFFTTKHFGYDVVNYPNWDSNPGPLLTLDFLPF